MRRVMTEISHLRQCEKTRGEKEEKKDFEPGGGRCMFTVGNHSFRGTVK